MSEAQTFLKLQTTTVTGCFEYSPAYNNSVYVLNNVESVSAYISFTDCIYALLQEGSGITPSTNRLNYYAMCKWADELAIVPYKSFRFTFYYSPQGCYRIKPQHGASFRIRGYRNV